MSNQEKIEMLEQAIDLVCEAQNLVDEVMDGNSHWSTKANVLRYDCKYSNIRQGNYTI